jgi:hypothetical protein
MKVSITRLWELTGRERSFIRKKLQGLSSVNGDKRAHLYESTEALPIIYSVESLEVARARHALSQASLNAVREESLRKQRIPIETVEEVWDQTFQSVAATIKAAKGKKLDTKLINELFDKFRAAPSKLNVK